MPARALLTSTASIALDPRPVRRAALPKKLHVIKSGDHLHSVRHNDTSLLAFAHYEAAHQHRDYLWRSYEATGSLNQGDIRDDRCLRLPFIQEAKPVNSDGSTDLRVDDMYFNDLRQMCLKNIVSLLIVTSISNPSSHQCTYHCHKYEPDLTTAQTASLLEENFTPREI